MSSEKVPAFIDIVDCDACESVSEDEERLLHSVPAEWRAALTSLLAETRSELSDLRAEMQQYDPNPKSRFKRRGEIQKRRADLIDRQRLLDDRLSYVKTLCVATRAAVAEDGDPLWQARGLLIQALDLLSEHFGK